MDEELNSETDLRSIYAKPSKPVLDKCFPFLDKHSRRFIELSPFFCIGSTQPNGLGDVSPRGGSRVSSMRSTIRTSPFPTGRGTTGSIR